VLLAWGFDPESSMGLRLLAQRETDN